jgi:two-component system cell cycle sensor histidine kinase/response regulator CckA
MIVLHLEDNPDDAAFAHHLLRKEWPECRFSCVSNRDDCLAALREGGFDLILSDFSMLGFDGLQALALAREHLPGTPFLFLSGTIGEERALEGVRAGAVDFVFKDNLRRLVPAVHRAMQEGAERRRREQAERRLRDQADIINRATEVIFVTDLDGRITLWNRGAERLYGVPADGALGRPVGDLVPPGVEQKLAAVDGGTAAAAEEWSGEVEAAPGSGRSATLDLRISLVRDDAGRPKARLAIATDITEKKKLEAQFLHAQRLESLGLLAAGIAHDLNNLLAPVLMAAPLLRVNARDPSDLQTLDILEKSAQRGASLVRQILGFAHAASGGLQVVQLRHLLREVVEVIAASFPKSIRIESDIAADLWPVSGNPTQLHQVILNLSVNARDAMLPRGGLLSIRAENRVIGDFAARIIEGARAGSFVAFEVRDTGTGIAPDLLARIWEPFFTTKPKDLGTGLGLSTVRGVVAGHGGFITVESAVGTGSTFRVHLPAVRQTPTLPVGRSEPAARRGQGELILLVDDEPTVRDLATIILTSYGYRVISAGDGREAIDRFLQHRDEIALVVSDLSMPKLDGHGLTVVLKRLQPDARIVIMTGMGGSPDGEAPVRADLVTATLAKPFTRDALLQAIERALHPPAAD